MVNYKKITHKKIKKTYFVAQSLIYQMIIKGVKMLIKQLKQKKIKIGLKKSLTP